MDTSSKAAPSGRPIILFEARVFCRNPAGDNAAVAAGSAPILSTPIFSTALATFY